MSPVEGKYKLSKVENTDEFLAKLGVNALIRKAASASGATLVKKNPHLHFPLLKHLCI